VTGAPDPTRKRRNSGLRRGRDLAYSPHSNNAAGLQPRRSAAGADSGQSHAAEARWSESLYRNFAKTIVMAGAAGWVTLAFVTWARKILLNRPHLVCYGPAALEPCRIIVPIPGSNPGDRLRSASTLAVSPTALGDRCAEAPICVYLRHLRLKFPADDANRTSAAG
jgi:hypothetical protein